MKDIDLISKLEALIEQIDIQDNIYSNIVEPAIINRIEEDNYYDEKAEIDLMMDLAEKGLLS